MKIEKSLKETIVVKNGWLDNTTHLFGFSAVVMVHQKFLTLLNQLPVVYTYDQGWDNNWTTKTFLL